ncbi:MAG TPA: spore maturation protein [Bacteroidota bacterium]|nr:spore maturation protein [Bacteroidota bacterium]
MKTVLEIVGAISILAIPALVVFVVLYGAVKKVKVYEAFVEGAKEGFHVAVRIIPYLVAMLVAIGVFRHGGAMDVLTIVLSPVTQLIGMPAETVPLALMRPLSGSGALGVMSEILTTHGPDSLIGRMVSVMMGSGETTFYVLAVYFGSVSVSRTRHAVPAGLVADLASILASVWIVNLLWG